MPADTALRFVMPAQLVRQVLQTLAPAIPAKKSSPDYHPLVTLTASTQDGLLFQAYDLDIAIAVRVPLSQEMPGVVVEQPGRCQLNYEQLRAALRSLRAPGTTPLRFDACPGPGQEGQAICLLSAADNGHLAWREALVIYNYAQHRLPAVFGEPGKQALLVPLPVFTQLVCSTSYAASRDPYRPALTKLVLELERGTFTAVAADAYRLASLSVLLPGADDWPQPLLLDAQRLAEVARHFPAQGMLRLRWNARQTVVQLDAGPHLTVWVECRASTYPTWRQVIPKQFETTTSFTVAVDEVVRKLKRLVEEAKADYYRVWFQLEPGAGLLTLATTAGSRSPAPLPCADMEAEPGTPHLRVGLDVRHVLDVCRANQGGHVRFALRSPTSPVRIEYPEQPGFCGALLPVLKSPS